MLGCNSFHDLASETANFIGSHSNSLKYSFPLDFGEKIDIKEDKTYFAKTSKYIKYCPIYYPPVCNEGKKALSFPHSNKSHKKIGIPEKKKKISQIHSIMIMIKQISTL